MNYIAEIQKQLLQFFNNEIDISFYNYEMGNEKFPYALLQNIKVQDQFIFPETKSINVNIEILSDAKTNIECIKILEKAKEKLKTSIFKSKHFKVVSVNLKSSELYKSKEGLWNALLKISFSIASIH